MGKVFDNVAVAEIPSSKLEDECIKLDFTPDNAIFIEDLTSAQAVAQANWLIEYMDEQVNVDQFAFFTARNGAEGKFYVLVPFTYSEAYYEDQPG